MKTISHWINESMIQWINNVNETIFHFSIKNFQFSARIGRNTRPDIERPSMHWTGHHTVFKHSFVEFAEFLVGTDVCYCTNFPLHIEQHDLLAVTNDFFASPHFHFIDMTDGIIQSFFSTLDFPALL
ncbi:MAG: hypothetical protein ACYC09_04920 [Bacteroidota bacterium]